MEEKSVRGEAERGELGGRSVKMGNNGVFFELSWEQLTTWLVAVASVLKQLVENLRCNR